jgi:hypothetical protein
VVDNLPNGCPHTKSAAEWAKARYLHRGHATGTSLPRQLVFEEAQGEWVMCLDSHVLLTKDVVAKTKEFIRSGQANPKNLYQGPLLYDDHINMATHFEPVWRDSMYGTWATDERVKAGEPFPIPMQGLGQFMMNKNEWPGFNTLFRGFGGEEGYIHSKVRLFGGQAMCVPWMTWLHRFGRPKGVPYRLFLEDRIFNYILGRRELGLPYQDVIEHFTPKVAEANLQAVVAEAEALDPSQGVFPERFRTVQAVRRSLPCFHRSATREIATAHSNLFTAVSFTKNAVPSGTMAMASALARIAATTRKSNEAGRLPQGPSRRRGNGWLDSSRRFPVDARAKTAPV